MKSLSQWPSELTLLRWMDLAERARTLLLGRNRGKLRSDRNLIRFYESAWEEAARHVGATVRPLGCSAYEIKKGDQRTFVSNNCSALDDLATHVVVRSKSAAYRVLRQNALPIPRHLEFAIDEISEAAAFLSRIGSECVVKPASDTGGGLGVTTGIRSRFQLGRAAWNATRRGTNALIEEQIPGDNYRLLYLDGRILDAVLRRPPQVVGDGVTRLEGLVEAENRRRLTMSRNVSHDLVTIDLEMEATLKKQGFSLRSIPSPGTEVVLKTAINQNGVQDNISAMHLLCPGIIDAGARASRALGVRLAGVDVICRDPSKPLEESGGVILEVNSPPGYFWHYHKADGRFPVAIRVLETLFE